MGIRSNLTSRPFGWLFLLCVLAGLPPRFAVAEALIIDHTATDLSQVPVAAIERAKQLCRVAYGHTSHGSQIVSGMEALRRRNPALFAFGNDGDGLSFQDGTPEGDLGNPDRSTWAERTYALLKGPGQDRNVILWSWCGQAGWASEEEIQGYLELMDRLEREFPNVVFVYMTGHLDGSGADGNLNRRNEQIRDFCRTHGKVLFDFADIESYDPDGQENYMRLGANDNCDYQRDGATRNWAEDWLRRNPGHGLALPDSAAHTQPLNAALKGQAFWYLLARLAGWDGGATR